MSFRSFLHLQAGRKAKGRKADKSPAPADNSGRFRDKLAPKLSPIKPDLAGGPDVLPLIIGPLILMVVGAGVASLFSRKRASEKPPRESTVVVMPPASPGPMETIVIPSPHTEGYRLSDHFTLAEFIASDTAKARSIDNTLPPELWAAAMGTCRGLEKIRTALGNRAIVLLSGYRCRKLNKAVHGAPDSDHMKALAADIIVPSFGTPYDIAKALSMLELKFDQLILEPTWVHVGFGPRMRGQLLTKLKSGGYLDGIVHGVHA